LYKKREGTKAFCQGSNCKIDFYAKIVGEKQQETKLRILVGLLQYYLTLNLLFL